MHADCPRTPSARTGDSSLAPRGDRRSNGRERRTDKILGSGSASILKQWHWMIGSIAVASIAVRLVWTTRPLDSKRWELLGSAAYTHGAATALPLHRQDDWRSALRVLGAAAAANSNDTMDNSDADGIHPEEAVTFSSFIDAYKIAAPQATLGTLLAICHKAYGNEGPRGDFNSINAKNHSKVELKVPVRHRLPVHKQWAKAPPLLLDDFAKRFGGSGNSTINHGSHDSYYTSGGESIVWILAGHIQGEAIRYVEEAMSSRIRIYPKSRIILVDNASPTSEAEKLRLLVEAKIPGNHSYVRNPPPSLYEQGAYHSGIRHLISTVPHPPENETVVFAQATTALLRPLPLEGIFQSGCDIRPMYPLCCGALATPPCAESEQIDWAPNVTPFAYPSDKKCKDICPDGKCAINFTNSFGHFKDRICGQQPTLGIMHASLISTGFLARDVLFSGLGFQLACKMSEVLSGYWILAGRSQPGASCTESLDMDEDGSGWTTYFTFKFHGGAEGWGQRLEARFLKWLQMLDMDSDGEVTFREMMRDESHWKQSTQELCTSAFVDEHHQSTIQRNNELAAEWYENCVARNIPAIADDDAYLPIMCKVAHAITGGQGKPTALVDDGGNILQLLITAFKATRR